MQPCTGQVSRRGRGKGAVAQGSGGEAGGFVEPLVPGEDILSSGEIIGSNEVIFDQFSKVIRNR